VPWGTGHAVGYWAHDAGPGLNRRETRPLAAGHVLAFDGFHAWAFDERAGGGATPVPAWGAGTKTISVEEMAVVTPDGAEYLVPPQERLILVPARGTERGRAPAAR
jgi:hypothetical protein